MASLVDAVEDFLATLREHESSPPTEKAFARTVALLGRASPKDKEAGARRLGEALADWPDPEAGDVALLLGCFAESGLEPLVAVEPLLAKAKRTTRAALA